jgi:hypothetical protein
MQSRYVEISFLYRFEEAAVGRTPGAKNRTPRELEAEAKRLLEKAKLMRKLEKLKQEAAKKK